MNFAPLYKKNKDGSIQQWTVAVDPDGGGVGVPRIEKEYGKVNGAMQYAGTTVPEGKNIGKSNETTPYEQAIAEALAQWTGKKKRGYVDSVDYATAGVTDDLITGGVEPMLAHDYHKHSSKLSNTVFVQPKLDGIRCIATIVDGKATLWTRTRKPILSMPHIVARLEALYPKQTVTLDGELYNHDYRDRFEEIVSLVRPSYPKPGHEVVRYHVYDVVLDIPFGDRDGWMVDNLPDEDPYIVWVPTWLVGGDGVFTDTVDGYHDRFVRNGYEGLIVRDAHAHYEHGRSYGLQKYKKFEDAEFVIVGVEEGKGKMAGKGIFVCEVDGAGDERGVDGARFSVKKEGPLDDLREYWLNPTKFVGKYLTVRFQGYTNGGVPRFPIGVSIRDYE